MVIKMVTNTVMEIITGIPEIEGEVPVRPAHPVEGEKVMMMICKMAMKKKREMKSKCLLHVLLFTHR
jgi:hypothetical protein